MLYCISQKLTKSTSSVWKSSPIRRANSASTELLSPPRPAEFPTWAGPPLDPAMAANFAVGFSGMHPEFRKIRTPYRKQSQPTGNPSVFFKSSNVLEIWVCAVAVFVFVSQFWHFLGLFSVLKVVLKRSTYSNFFYICIWKLFCFYLFYYFQIRFHNFQNHFRKFAIFEKHLFSYFLICLWNFHNFQNFS